MPEPRRPGACPLRRLPGITREAMVMVGGILLILAVAQAFADYLVYAGIPEQLFQFIQTHVQSKIAFLVLLNILLLVEILPPINNF